MKESPFMEASLPLLKRLAVAIKNFESREALLGVIELAIGKKEVEEYEKGLDPIAKKEALKAERRLTTSLKTRKGETPATKTRKRRRKISEDGKRRISEAQKARWALIRAAKNKK